MDILDFTRAVEVIDCHVHVFRSDDHAREFYYYYLMRSPVMSGPVLPPAMGTLEQLREMMQRTGVRHVNNLMFTWAGTYYRDGLYTLADDAVERARGEQDLRARIVHRILDNNEWVLQSSLQNRDISCFIYIDPVLMDEKTMLAEVEDKVGGGAKGIKTMFPDSGIFANDKRLWPLYDWCQRREVPIQIVCAEYAPNLNRPAHSAEALAAFPKLRLIFSHIGHGHHFGHGCDAEFVELARQYPNVCGDLSLRLPEVAEGHIDPHEMVAHLRKIGTDRILYGSNFCLNEMLNGDKQGQTFQISNTLKGLEALATLPLTEEERADIAGRNFHRWVGVSA